MRLKKPATVLLSSALALIGAVVAFASVAQAQTPTAPRDPTICMGTMTFSTEALLTGSQGRVDVHVTGLTPDAPFALFIGSEVGTQPLVTGTTDAAGTVDVGLMLAPLFPAALAVQVTTPVSCAAATLPVVGPAVIRCELVTATGTIVCGPRNDLGVGTPSQPPVTPEVIVDPGIDQGTDPGTDPGTETPVVPPSEETP